MSQRTILVIDDEAGLRHTLTLILQEEDYTVFTAENGEAGLRIALAEQPDLVLCDIRMPKLDGLGFLESYAAAGGEALVLMMSAYGTLDTAMQAMQRGAYDYISKPFNADEVLLTIRKAEEREQLRREVTRLKKQVGEVPGGKTIIAKSASMREVLQLADRVAQYPSTVLVTGESGTGKEAVARLIHQQSPRSGHAFVAVNCGAIPENLLETELFGHEKGAFTGADKAREGLFGEANGGTIFLDEIGELPQSLQVKLLRVLQERKLRPVGGAAEKEIDVRVLAATSRNLPAMVLEGEFREDLFYRINVIHLHLPSLRARPDDIVPIAEHFFRGHAERLGIEVGDFPAELNPLLLAYPWPGNVRELENVLERALILSHGAPGPEHLPPHVRQGTALFPLGDDDGDLSVKRRLPALEKELIARALDQANGNRTRAADILELSVKALSYKIKDYGLE